MKNADGETVWVLDQAVRRRVRTASSAGMVASTTSPSASSPSATCSAPRGRQSAVSDLAERALSGADADSLMQCAVDLAARLEGVDHSFVWEQPEEGAR
jgi:hypothetical protein